MFESDIWISDSVHDSDKYNHIEEDSDGDGNKNEQIKGLSMDDTTKKMRQLHSWIKD